MSDHLFELGVLAIISFAILSMEVCAEEFNGTTYRLGLKQMEVIQPVNASSINLTLHNKAENLTLLNEDGKSVIINSSYYFWRGNYVYNIVFKKRVSGDLIYFLPQQGQQFILPLSDGGPVRVILPAGYTTGDRILGLAKPKPDEFKDRNVLIWWNTSQIQFIEVSYYKENAIQVLMKIFAVLIAAALVLLVDYYIGIRRLRAVREDVEKKS